MKKTKLLFSLTISGLIFGGVQSTVFADDVNTEGTIEWITPTGPGEVIKPEVPDVVIEPGGGGSTSGSLRLQHVPDFNFGKREIQGGVQRFNPTLSSYKYKVAGAQPGAETNTDYYIPHFIQVTDLRGITKGWDLRVSATKFINASKNEKFENATITFNSGARLSNTIYDEATIASRMNVYAGNLVIPMEENDTASIMATKDMEKENSTDGTQTSLVLDKDYQAEYVSEYKAEDENQGVVFEKAKDDIAVIGTYISTITWTLADVL